MIISAEDIKNDTSLSVETEDTESLRSFNSAPVNQHKIYSAKMHQNSGINLVEETDDETPVSPTPSSNSKFGKDSLDSPIVDADRAMKAAFAIMDGVSVSDITLVKENEIYEAALNDEQEAAADNKIPKHVRSTRTLDSSHSRSVGSTSALSDVACDRMSLASSVDSRRSYNSNVRILRTPDGKRRVNRRVKTLPQRHSFPDLEGDSPAAEGLLSAPISPGASLVSAPEETPEDERSFGSHRSAGSLAASQRSAGTAGSQRSYPSSVRILRTPDGRRRKRPSNGNSTTPTSVTRHSFAGMVTTTSAPDLPSIPDPSAIGSTSRRVHSDKVVPHTPMLRDDDIEKGVQFSSVKIRYYERVVDINPACSSGVAIGLGWKYNKTRGLSIDEYELQKGGVRYNARQLVLPRSVREDIARSFGFTQKDIAKGTRANLKIRNERKQTIDNLSMMGVEEKIEGAKRKVKKVLSFRKKRVA